MRKFDSGKRLYGLIFILTYLNQKPMFQMFTAIEFPPCECSFIYFYFTLQLKKFVQLSFKKKKKNHLEKSIK